MVRMPRCHLRLRRKIKGSDHGQADRICGGTGALGGYVGGYLAHHGQDVTLIDMWPENIEAIRARGLELDGVTPEEKFTVKNAKTMHLTEVQSLGRKRSRSTSRSSR